MPVIDFYPPKRRPSTQPDPICDKPLSDFLAEVRAMSSAGYKPTGRIVSPDWSTLSRDPIAKHSGADYPRNMRGGNRGRYHTWGR